VRNDSTLGRPITAKTGFIDQAQLVNLIELYFNATVSLTSDAFVWYYMHRVVIPDEDLYFL
jgi:hypothetical protein